MPFFCLSNLTLGLTFVSTSLCVRFAFNDRVQQRKTQKTIVYVWFDFLAIISVATSFSAHTCSQDLSLVISETHLSPPYFVAGKEFLFYIVCSEDSSTFSFLTEHLSAAVCVYDSCVSMTTSLNSCKSVWNRTVWKRATNATVFTCETCVAQTSRTLITFTAFASRRAETKTAVEIDVWSRFRFGRSVNSLLSNLTFLSFPLLNIKSLPRQPFRRPCMPSFPTVCACVRVCVHVFWITNFFVAKEPIIHHSLTTKNSACECCCTGHCFYLFVDGFFVCSPCFAILGTSLCVFFTLKTVYMNVIGLQISPLFGYFVTFAGLSSSTSQVSHLSIRLSFQLLSSFFTLFAFFLPV